jgi:quinol-cytochrome oxidoreductase complex cytochrome b subunit
MIKDNMAIEDTQESYYPYFLFKEVIVILITFSLVVFVLSLFFPVGLEDPADPTDNLYVPKPEWYFLWFYQLLKYFPGKLEIIAASIIPAVIFLFLLILPFIDRNPVKKPTQRPVAMVLMLLAVSAIMLLTILGFMA